MTADSGLLAAQSHLARKQRALDSIDRRIDAGDSSIGGAELVAARTDVEIAQRVLRATELLLSPGD